MIEELYSHGKIKCIRSLERYIKLVEILSSIDRPNINLVKHHILPKSKDMFPQYKDFKIFPKNLLLVTDREHYILHLLLHKAFKGSSQTHAFYHMCNIINKKNSRHYAECREYHIHKLTGHIKSEETRKKLSIARKGKKLSESHRKSLIGHEVKQSTREKLSAFNTGKKRSLESIERQKETYKKNPNNLSRGNNLNTDDQMKMSITKMNGKILHSPFGIFKSYREMSLFTGIDQEFLIQVLYRRLTSKPRKISVEKLNIQYAKGFTWKDYGFSIET